MKSLANNDCKNCGKEITLRVVDRYTKETAWLHNVSGERACPVVSFAEPIKENN